MSIALETDRALENDRAAGATAAATADLSSAFTARLIAWSLGMVVVIGGSGAALVGLSTGDWIDGLVVGAFLSVFIAPALGGLFAGVLFIDKQERERAAARRAGPEVAPTSIDTTATDAAPADDGAARAA
jgi:hypothetical protein